MFFQLIFLFLSLDKGHPGTWELWVGSMLCLGVCDWEGLRWRSWAFCAACQMTSHAGVTVIMGQWTALFWSLLGDTSQRAWLWGAEAIQPKSTGEQWKIWDLLSYPLSPQLSEVYMALWRLKNVAYGVRKVDHLTTEPLRPISWVFFVGSMSDKYFSFFYKLASLYFTMWGFCSYPPHWEIVPEAGSSHAFCDFQPKFIHWMVLYLCQCSLLALFDWSTCSNQMSSQPSFCQKKWAQLLQFPLTQSI